MAQPLLQSREGEGNERYYRPQDNGTVTVPGNSATESTPESPTCVQVPPATGARVISSSGSDVPLVLLPVSMTPAVALNPEVQSVDLYGNAKALDNGQGCCSYLCVRSPPPFDWVPFLHAAAHRNAAVSARSGPSESSSQSQSSNVAATPPSWFVAVPPVGTGPPLGTPATLLTMFGNSQLIFRAVREINRAHSFFWQIVILSLVLLILFLPGLGLIFVLLIGCCSSLRKVLDDAALHRMRLACETVNHRMAAFGLGFLLMEGFAGNGPVDLEQGSLAGTSLPDRRIWVLRVYMLPRREGYTPAAAAAAAASASPRHAPAPAHAEHYVQADEAPGSPASGTDACNATAGTESCAEEAPATACGGQGAVSETQKHRKKRGKAGGKGGAGRSTDAGQSLKEPLLPEQEGE
ncbi:hypothetical protein TGME49_305810 [Toxoplasma gondii ME49]|uniref:Transmembrane protein n=1 Tax=Toxoplasma gondii (strain ATCC 50611 / Me49) TaxID=508771 RepID=S8G6T6_TOXGM|nr:hypothetical protein TGME49_305810 [Toxoplasma gondii ME49]EPT27415.1 hypothetical protein TGME49_305810 [Toxoplasma gondii ME49]|eukprot:XP_002370353.1 hypothetical protein TGME49_305810 [Toxoplasma gondii ME49]